MKKIIFILLFAFLFLPMVSAMTDEQVEQGWPFSRQIIIGRWAEPRALCDEHSFTESACKEQINKTIANLKAMHIDAVQHVIEETYFLAERYPDKSCIGYYCSGHKKFGEMDNRPSWDYINWTAKRFAEEGINYALDMKVEEVASGMVVQHYSILGNIFGTQFNVMRRPGTINSDRLDFAYSVPRNYIIEMLAWIVNTHPGIKGIRYEESGYWMQTSNNCANYGECESWSPPILQYVKEHYGYIPDPTITNSTHRKWDSTVQQHMLEAMEYYQNLFYEGVRNNITRKYPDFYLQQEPLTTAFMENIRARSTAINVTKQSEQRWIDIVSGTYGGNNGGSTRESWCNEIALIESRTKNVLVTNLISIRQSGIINNYSLDQMNYARTCRPNNVERVFVYEHLNLSIPESAPGTLYGKPFTYLVNNVPLPPYITTQTKTVSAPTFSPVEGTYYTAQNVSIFTNTANATVRYTIDGTSPSKTSTEYTVPIYINNSRTIKAKAWGLNLKESPETTATYIFIPTVKEETYNLVNNSGFESGNTSWTFYTNGIGKFSTGPSAFSGNNSAVIDIYSNGSNIQLYQQGLSIEPNTSYRLSFAAYSTSGNDLAVKLFKDVSPYTNYGLIQTFDLTKNWKTFTTEFTATGFSSTINDGRLQFWLVPFAASGDTYYLDEVRLEKIDASSVNKYDYNKDGIVDIFDLLFISDRFGNTTKYPYPDYDTNSDGNVDILDMVSVSNKISK